MSAQHPSVDSEVDLNLAVSLFERGFAPDLVEAAVKSCGTLEEALSWISRQESSASSEIDAGQRRRIRMKKDMPMERARSTKARGCSSVYSTKSSASGSQKTAPETPSVSTRGRAASCEQLRGHSCSRCEWLEEASARWPAIVEALRAKMEADEGCAAPMTPPSQSSKRKLTDAEDEKEMQICFANEVADLSSAGGVQAENAAAQVPLRSEAAEAPSKRPPATPQADGEAAITNSPAGRARRSSTPGSALRINVDGETCELCCNEIPSHKAVRLTCGHGWYCAVCVVRHAKARLAVGAASVPCPECNVNLAERVLRKLLPEDVIDSLQARSLEQAVSSATDLWACPTPNCPMRVALEENEQVPKLKCPECKKESCLRCGAQPYHKGLTCEEHAKRVREKLLAKNKKQRLERDRINGEESLMQWIKETGSKQCPKCKIAITKCNLDNQDTQYSECHKMLCRNCNTKFCFKCLAELTDTYTCGCTRVEHGFVDPNSGKRIKHLSKAVIVKGAGGKPKFAPKFAAKAKGRPRHV